uniref:Uncharacterized protein n=1 Tax=Aegilops tauschii subsp. strangulata TaxID=200361 RepID=A0A453HN43_AEGTS
SSSWLLLPSSVSRPFFSKQQPLDPPRKSPPSGEPHRFRPATALRAEADARRRRKPCPLQSGEMLGEFFSRVLLLLFGYAMPAFECFKTVEARPNDAHMLRFWCQYWIIVAMVIAVESFISWRAKSIPFARSFPLFVLKLPSHLCTHAIICRCQDANVWRNQAGFLCVPVVPQDKGQRHCVRHLPPAHGDAVRAEHRAEAAASESQIGAAAHLLHSELR